MRRFHRSLVVLGLLPLLASGCGRRGAPPGEEAAPAAETETQAPAEQLTPTEVFGATAVENLRLVPMEVEVRNLPRGWEGARLAALSDFQLGLWPDNEPVAVAAVQRAIEAGAEVFLLLGGYLADERQSEALRRVLAPLRGRSAVAILSLYDARSDSIAARVRRALEEQGITIVRNGRAPLVRGGDTLNIAGLAPNYAYLPETQQTIAVDTLGRRDTPILLTPFPELAPRISANRFTLVLAGRTLCGQVDLPGTARLATLDAEMLRGMRVEGHDRLYQVRGNTLFITCGTGYTFLPVRLSAPAEVLLITLRRPGTPNPPAADTTAPPDST